MVHGLTMNYGFTRRHTPDPRHAAPEVSASTELTRTMRKAVRVLAEAGMPSLVVGGYAVQKNGYPRFTSDINLVVMDVAQARHALTLNGFRENAGSSMPATDQVSKVEVDFAAGRRSVGPGPHALPIPDQLFPEPNLASLAVLTAIKLSSYLGSPVSRLRDLADVVELIKRALPPRDLDLPPEMSALYLQIWDGLQAEAHR